MSLPPNRAVHFAQLSLTRLPLLRANPLRCHDASVIADSAVVAEWVLQTTASQMSLDAYELCFARAVGCLPTRSASACFRRAGKPAIRLLWPQSRPTSSAPAPWHNAPEDSCRWSSWLRRTCSRGLFASASFGRGAVEYGGPSRQGDYHSFSGLITPDYPPPGGYPRSG